MEYFFLGIESFKPFDRTKKWDVRSWQVEVDFSGCRSRQLRKVLVGHSLQESFRDICREDVPSAGDCLTDNHLLRASGAGTCVPVDITFSTVLEASHRESRTYDPHPLAVLLNPLELDHPTGVNDVVGFTPRFAAEALVIIPDAELLESCLLHFIPMLVHLVWGQKVVISLHHDAPSGGSS